MWFLIWYEWSVYFLINFIFQLIMTKVFYSIIKMFKIGIWKQKKFRTFHSFITKYKYKNSKKKLKIILEPKSTYASCVFIASTFHHHIRPKSVKLSTLDVKFILLHDRAFRKSRQYYSGNGSEYSLWPSCLLEADRKERNEISALEDPGKDHNSVI